MIQKKLIVGANSYIVKLLGMPSNFDIISHDQLDFIDFDLYSEIILFSWSKFNTADNLAVIAKIPPRRLLFISTIAVLANQKRKQWAKYPNDKERVERIVTSQGGRVLRIAAVDLDLISRLARAYAYTSIDSLRTFLVTSSWPKGAQVHHLFEINSCSLRSDGLFVRCLNTVTALFPRFKVFQLPLIIVHRIFQSINYGYTYECHEFIHEELQIGYGALGSSFDLSHKSTIRKIIASGFKNIKLNGNGFINFIIGKENIGLSKYWHGVKTSLVGDSNCVSKNVLIKVPRPNLPSSRTEIAEVLSVCYTGRIWTIVSINNRGDISYNFCKKMVLAAGAIENIRLLSGLGNINATLDDDENACVGWCNLDDAVRLGFVRKIGPLVKNIGGILLRKDFFIEVRPRRLSSEYKEISDHVFYSDSTFRIVLNLISKMSFSRLNEAFFNKFSISFATHKMAIFVQVIVKDAVSIICEDSRRVSIERKRVASAGWEAIQELVGHHIHSFESFRPIQSFDGLHLKGGLGTDVENIVKDLPINCLVILGSPSKGRIDPFHTTRLLQDEVAALRILNDSEISESNTSSL